VGANSEQIDLWQRTIRDFATVAVGCFAAIFGILEVRDAAVLTVILGFAATMLGLPTTLWLDSRRRNGGGNGSG